MPKPTYKLTPLFYRGNKSPLTLFINQEISGQ